MDVERLEESYAYFQDVGSTQLRAALRSLALDPDTLEPLLSVAVPEQLRTESEVPTSAAPALPAPVKRPPLIFERPRPAVPEASVGLARLRRVVTAALGLLTVLVVAVAVGRSPLPARTLGLVHHLIAARSPSGAAGPESPSPAQPTAPPELAPVAARLVAEGARSVFEIAAADPPAPEGATIVPIGVSPAARALIGGRTANVTPQLVRTGLVGLPEELLPAR